MYQHLRAGARTGRPCAEAALIDQLEATLGRCIHRQKPGPKHRGNQHQFALDRQDNR